jgi:hypothetical protein
MTSIRKFVYAALLAASMSVAIPSPAAAQEPVRGRFTLTHDVNWGNAKVPPGEYEFSFNTSGISPVLVLSKLSGPRAGYMVLVSVSPATTSSGTSRIILEPAEGSSYVTAMELPEFGMTLHFPMHARSEKQIAKTTTVATSGQ